LLEEVAGFVLTCEDAFLEEAARGAFETVKDFLTVADLG
jgi:hypothetical protein